jgi:hypothetical protein
MRGSMATHNSYAAPFTQNLADNSKSFCWSAFYILISALLILSCSGCGPTEAPRYHLSGNITFNGKPIPKGTILFDPDLAAGHDGAQGYANIENGKFDTKISGRGHCGGKVLLRIHGGDGAPLPELPFGNPLFPETSLPLELPTADAVRDIEVPTATP